MTTAAVTLNVSTFGTARVDSDVALATQGDASAFERIYRLHVGRIHGLCRRMLGSHEADEVTQDVFVRTWQKLATFRGDSAFGTWLHRLAVNVIIERRRTYAIQRTRIADDPAVIDTITVPAGRADLAVDVEYAMQELPDGAREIFVLHDIEGYKHREIADLLDITTGTSKRQLHRARMLMRRHLGAS